MRGFFSSSDRNLQEETEKTEPYQLADPFGFLQKETKVTKTHSRQTLRASFSWLTSVQSLIPEFSADFADGRGSRFNRSGFIRVYPRHPREFSFFVPSVASCKTQSRFGCGSPRCDKKDRR
jgi:hypothetical protein